MTERPAAVSRRYGLDWLRITVFGFLIFFHIGEFFKPTGWQGSAAAPIEWITIPMLALSAWRMSLLFVISGVASRFLIGKARIGFGRSRTLRLLPPLLFAGGVIVAPQAFYNATANYGYQQSFAHFYIHDYLRFSNDVGLILPTWGHLWFVAYLLAYSWLLALILMLPPQHLQAIQRAFDKVFTGWRLLVVPLLYLCAAKYLLAPWTPQTYDFVNDWHAHAVFLACFAFGVGMARSTAVWVTIGANWRVYGGLAIAAFGFVAFKELSWPGDAVPPHAVGLAYDFARELQRWGAILALFGLADRYWNHDNAARRYFTEAVFPYYIAHEAFIVIVLFSPRMKGLDNLTLFGLTMIITFVGCALFYELVRRSGPLRPLFGLSWPVERHPRASAPAHLAPQSTQ
jgi:glucans biosynthesis protein C